MTAPGSTLRARLARWLSPSTLERVVDPAIADMQFALARATEIGRVRRCWLRVAGTFTVIRTVLAWAARRPVHAVQDLTAAEWLALGLATRRFLIAALLTTVGFTVLPVVFIMSSGESVPAAAVVYLVPQAVPMALLAALVAAVALTHRAERTQPYVRVALGCLAVAGGVASLALMASAIPEANLQFRVEQVGAPVLRGPGELTLTQLWHLDRGGVTPDLTLPIDRHAASTALHLRLALVTAALLLPAAVLSLTRRLERRSTTIAVAMGVTIAYYAAMWLAMDASIAVAPALATWSPSIVLLAFVAIWSRAPARMPPARPTSH